MTQHFLITRFNLKTDLWSNDKRGGNILTEEWLADRFELFEKYCLPSIQNQSNLNFTWLVYFGTDTPEKYKAIIEKYAEDFPVLDPKYVLDYNAFTELHPIHIEELCKSETEYVISSRIDNDDAYHKDAIDQIQKGLDGKPVGSLLNLTTGLCYYISQGQLITQYDFPSGPFVSILEDKKSIKSIYQKSHMDFVNDNMINQLVGEPYWMQIIHEKNIMNTIRGIPFISFKRFAHFGFQTKYSVSFKLLVKYFGIYVGGRILSKSLKKRILPKLKMK